MTIRQLSLNDFRNLQSTTVELNKNFNLITGNNGSGKTSFLEALHILCQGKSFKTGQLSKCITHNKNEFLLLSKFSRHKVGISRTHSKTSILLNGERINRLSNLAEQSPIRIIDSSCYELTKGKPEKKREYIDWCLFHVKQSFRKQWSSYYHALKQRNKLLKTKSNLRQLDYWDEFLTQQCKGIYEERKKYISILNNNLNGEIKKIISDLDITLNYEPGWNTAYSLKEIFLKNREKDLKQGFTQHGIHRDNIRILDHQSDVREYLSRGQLKRLAVALYLAQITLIGQKSARRLILLIDDIKAELDRKSIESIMKILQMVDIQIIISAITEDKYLYENQQDYKLFHVEHGIIKAVKK